MPITYGDAGTNRTLSGITYGDAGTNRTIKEAWYGDAGTNRLVYAAASISTRTVLASSTSPTDADAGYRLSNTGGAFELKNGAATAISGEWLSAGSASDYEVRATLSSGTLSSGTTGSWLNLGTTREWHTIRTDNTSGDTDGVLLIEIRLAATGTVVTSATITLRARVL